MELGLFSRIKLTRAEIQLQTSHLSEAEGNTGITQRSHITLNLIDYAYVRRNIPNVVLNSQPNFYCYVIVSAVMCKAQRNKHRLCCY